MASPELLKGFAILAQMFGRDMSQTPEVLDVYLRELSAYPAPAVSEALRRCMRECRTFPALSEILARMDDGRPGAEEAWAMLPKGEGASVVWTDEMARASAIASPISADPIAARMAFREAYVRLLAEARAQRRPACWRVSLGHDPIDRERALRDAVDKRRLTPTQAREYLPHLGAQPTEMRTLLAEPPLTMGGLEKLDGVLAKVLENAPEHVIAQAETRRAEKRADPEKQRRHEDAVRAQVDALRKGGTA